MIEVERKFLLTEEQQARLLDKAVFRSEKTYTDTYFDTENFTLMRQDLWLRQRGSVFELKIGQRHAADHLTTQYNELETEKEIRSFLHFPDAGTLSDILQEKSYFPFCTCTTTRRHYTRGSFGIDIDNAKYDDFSYSVAEIEVLVNDAALVDNAIYRITTFADSCGLTNTYVRGKVVEYLWRKRRETYTMLIAEGILHDPAGLKR